MSQTIGHKKLAYIHIVKRELNLSDVEYRDILEEVAGVKSAKDLTERTFRKLINHLIQTGKHYIRPGGPTVKQKLFMRSLANNMGWSDENLNNFICKYYHKSNIDELTRKEAINAIESLKHVRTHTKARRKSKKRHAFPNKTSSPQDVFHS